MAGLSLGTMGAALFVLGIFLFLNHNVSRLLQGWEDDPGRQCFSRRRDRRQPVASAGADSGRESGGSGATII